MPVFTYKGTNRSGGSVAGEMAAASKNELQSMLRRQQITATKMSEKGKEFNLPTFGGGIKAKELAIFTRQFSVMIDAGLPLVQCLEILATQQENKTFQKVLTGTRSAVEGGSTLSAADPIDAECVPRWQRTRLATDLPHARLAAKSPGPKRILGAPYRQRSEHWRAYPSHVLHDRSVSRLRRPCSRSAMTASRRLQPSASRK